MSNFDSREAATLKKLAELVDTVSTSEGGIHIFDKREVATIKRVIAAYEGWESVGRLGRSIRSVLMLIGFFVLAFATVKGWLAEWVRTALTGG